MDQDGDLMIEMAQYIVDRSIGKYRSQTGLAPDSWICGCCRVCTRMPDGPIPPEPGEINHKEGCLYLKSKALLLIANPQKVPRLWDIPPKTGQFNKATGKASFPKTW